MPVASISAYPRHFRFPPHSDRNSDMLGGPFCAAINGLGHTIIRLRGRQERIAHLDRIG